MKLLRPLILSTGFFLLCACTVFEARQPPARPVAPPKPLAIQVGKDWKIVEEAPNLSDERGRIPFQTEQSIQPEGVTKPAAPTEERKIETR